MPSSGLGGLSGKLVYGGSWSRALIIALGLSWGMMNLIALVLERRTMLAHPGGQYKAFYYGDLICLPGIVLAIWYLGRRMPKRPNLSCSPAWHLGCFFVGLAAGVGIHLLDASSHFYTSSQMTSPTKLYHDFIVMVLYTYILLSAGVPALLQSKGGATARVIIVVLLAVFAGLNYYDSVHRPHHGHVNYDWRHMRPG